MQDYFNYFTEIERHFQTKRDSFTLLSTLDWVLIENWKDQGIPLEVVLRGMDRAFERAKRKIGSLAYCLNAVAEVATEQREMHTEAPAPPDFSSDEVRSYLDRLSGKVRALGQCYAEFASRFDSIAEMVDHQDTSDLRVAESTLSALEEQLIAILKVAADPGALVAIQQDVERSLSPFRSRMTVEQLAMLEQQLWKRKLMERHDVPRLSFFYLI